MKKISANLVLLSGILCLGIFSTIPSATWSISSEDDKNLKNSGYWSLSPITIVTNSDWESLATNDWCNGSGKWDDPYIIENVTIDGGDLTYCIRVISTDVFFKIHNCLFFNSKSWGGPQGAEPAIFLQNITNGLILRNNLSYNGLGIRMDACKNITIEENLIFNCTYECIFLQISLDTFQGSSNNTVSNNICYNNDIGICVDNSPNNTIKGNNLSENRLGINLSDVNYTLVYNNTVINNSFFGIGLHYTSNITVEENYIINNENQGIFVAYCNNNSLKSNFISKNYGLNDSEFVGIDLADSSFNRISKNIINASFIGINLYWSSNNSILNNTIRYVSQCIVETFSSGNNIYNNNCSKMSQEEPEPEPPQEQESIPGYNLVALIGVCCVFTGFSIKKKIIN